MQLSNVNISIYVSQIKYINIHRLDIFLFSGCSSLSVPVELLINDSLLRHNSNLFRISPPKCYTKKKV